MSTKKTLEVVGKKTIHICTSTNNTRRATVALMIVSDGTLLPSTIILKGKYDRRIAQKEFAMYPSAHHYCCQDAAWIEEQVMLAWVEKVLAPCVATAPEDIIPLLTLDSYQCHMMASVVYKIQELGKARLCIPAGIPQTPQNPQEPGFKKKEIRSFLQEPLEFVSHY
jgi:hypothetical protein